MKQLGIKRIAFCVLFKYPKISLGNLNLKDSISMCYPFGTSGSFLDGRFLVKENKMHGLIDCKPVKLA